MRAMLKTSFLAAGFVLAAASAQAAPIVGSVASGDLTTLAPLTGATVVDFETVAIGNYASLSQGSPSVTFTASTQIEIDSDYAGNYNTRGLRHITNHGDDPFAFTFTFGAPTSAFALLFGASDVNWTLSAYGASGLIESLTMTPTYGSNSGNYFGIAAAGITYATLVATSSYDYIFIDNFTYQAGSASVPAPGALALLGLGLVALGAARRRKAA